MEFRVGITERGDAGLDFSWYNKLKECEVTILITKCLNNEFLDYVMKAHKKNYKIILHVTCTGLGGFPVERNVKPKEWTHAQVQRLLLMGFPVEQLVLRLDPIIPTPNGLITADSVLKLFADTGIKRVRYSFLDMYAHVVERFKQEGIPLPYTTFNAPKEMQENAITMLCNNYSLGYEYEACAEYTPHRVGCVSAKDLKIFGIEGNLIGSSNQRKTCSCVGNKTELLTNKKRCPNKCSYCFWRD